MRKGPLILVILALAILCYLAFLFWPSGGNHDVDAFIARRDLSLINEALYIYRKKEGIYPRDLEFLRSTESPLSSEESRRLFERKWSYVYNSQLGGRKASEVSSSAWLVRTSKPVGMKSEVLTLWFGGELARSK